VEENKEEHARDTNAPNQTLSNTVPSRNERPYEFRSRTKNSRFALKSRRRGWPEGKEGWAGLPGGERTKVKRNYPCEDPNIKFCIELGDGTYSTMRSMEELRWISFPFKSCFEKSA